MEGTEGDGLTVLQHSILPREVLQPLRPRALLCVRQLWSCLQGEMDTVSKQYTAKGTFLSPSPEPLREPSLVACQTD